MKKLFSHSTTILLLSIVFLSTTIAAAPTPQPNATFTLVQGLPAVMQVGESYTVEIQMTSDIPFVAATALPTAYFPGRYVVAAQGDHSGRGTTATFYVTFTAKGSTAQLPGGVAPVAVVAGAHYQGGFVVSQRFDFLVAVP